MADSKNYNNSIRKAAIFSSIGNAILAIGKITVGIISGSMAVLSDGIDSFMDVLSSIIMVFTTRIMKKPPNINYPYGYNRAETITTKAISFFIFFAGVQLVYSSIDMLFFVKEHHVPNTIAIYITLFSIAGKIILSLHQKKQGKKHNSSMLITNSKNMLYDIIISIGVLIGLLFTAYFKIPEIDLILAFIIGVFVIYSGIKIFLLSSTELMDGIKDTSIYTILFKTICKIDGVYNPHRARIRMMGNQYIIAIDIEVDGDISVNESHKLSEKVEDEIKNNIPNVYDILVHIEPYGESHKSEKFGVSKNNLP